MVPRTKGSLSLKQIRRVSRQKWISLSVATACTLVSPMLAAKPMSESAIQMRTIRSDESGVVLQTRRGDSLREIAKYYSRKNNIPFQKTYDALVQANVSNFPNGDPDLMQVGVQIILPPAAQITSGNIASIEAAKPVETTVNDNVAVSSVNNTNSPAAPSTSETSQTPINNAETNSEAQSNVSWFNQIPRSLWFLLLPVLLLCVGIAYLMRRPKSKADSVTEKSFDDEPLLSDATLAVIAQEYITDDLNAVEVDAIVDLPELTESVAIYEQESQLTKSPEQGADPIKTQTATVGDSEVFSSPQLNVTQVVEQTEIQITEFEPPPTNSSVPADAADEIQNRFKQVLQGLTAEQLDLRQIPSNVVAQASGTPSRSQAERSSTIPFNVNKLLRQYAAQHTVNDSGEVNYYALAERTRLQKWMSMQSEDDLLEHAEKAHQQGYPNVAHHILNEVLLRGSAAQSTRALDLRNAWHIQSLKQHAQNDQDR